jgi:hypothetical protein
MDALFSIERDLLMQLGNRLDQTPLPETSTGLEEIDHSLLSSAWQKAIRRGDSHLATRCALELHRRAPESVWRRIRIIALEDISVGDIDLVATILAVAGKRAWQRPWGERHVLAYLVDKLAQAPKSRTACDLAVALPPEHIPVDNWMGKQNLGSFDRQSLFLLASAWRNTASYSTYEGGRWRTISSGNRRLRDRYLDEVEAPPLVRFIATRGSGTEALNVLLVPAYQLKQLGSEQTRPLISPASSWNRIHGLPAYAFCMYSAPGMQALGQFLKHSSWTERLQAMGVRQPRKALGYLTFYIEGGHCSKPLRVKHAPKIQQWSEEVALGRFGVPADQVEVLKGELIKDLRHLNAFRRSVPVRSSSHED